MYALITGATSGMGRDMAIVLSNMGYKIIAVGRREQLLDELQNVLKTEITKYPCDLSNEENCKKLFNDFSDYDIRVFINNAGFGYVSDFNKDDLDIYINMINTNVLASTILFNLFLSRFKEKNMGYILNVASASAFTIGPLMGVYYATKSFLYKLTLSTYEELRREKSNVTVSVLCPGPVATEFDKVANVDFSLKAQNSMMVSELAIKKMFKKKLIIIPSRLISMGKFFSRFLSEKRMARIGYRFQKKKIDRKSK